MATENCCEIKWIDDNGNPTPDQNQPVGEVRHLPERSAGMNPTYRPEWSRWFRICAKHLADMPGHGWEFRATDGRTIPQILRADRTGQGA